MQYFTFMGLNDYNDAIYKFDDPDYKVEHISKYVQDSIIERYKEEITTVYILCTKLAKEKHGILYKDKLEQSFDFKIELIDIEDNTQITDIIEILNEVLTEDFIIDVTHSFRSIPLSVTLAVRYLEVTKGIRLQHLYYGSFNKEEEYGIIYDLINQYTSSLVANELESFDRYLKANINIENDLYDDKINRLLESFSYFNKVIEMCQFSNTVGAVRKIVESSKSILKEEQKYILLIPYIMKILEKLEPIYKEQNVVNKKIYFIQLLLDHGQIQIAITFTDQLLREELVHKYYFPYAKSFTENMVFQLSDYCGVYDLSQDLLMYYEVREVSKYIPKDSVSYIRKKVDYNNVYVIKVNSEVITKFYDELRNVVNHGGSIKSELNPYKIIQDCLVEIKNLKIEKREKEYAQ